MNIPRGRKTLGAHAISAAGPGRAARAFGREIRDSKIEKNPRDTKYPTVVRTIKIDAQNSPHIERAEAIILYVLFIRKSGQFSYMLSCVFWFRSYVPPIHF